MPIPPPPPRELVLSLIVRDLRLRVPRWVGFVVLTLALPTGLWAALGDSRGAPSPGPVPLPMPQVPLLSSTPAFLPALAMVLPGTLPPPGPNQRRAGQCESKGSEIEINGGCWIATDKKPPCPDGFQWEHESRCWRPVAEARPVPTTGSPRHVGVADP